MKLLYCPECEDLFNLRAGKWKICSCGKARGRYMDGLQAVYSGGIPVGFQNRSFRAALLGQPEKGLGRRFEAFVIPKECPTMEKIDTECGPEEEDGPWAEGWEKRSGNPGSIDWPENGQVKEPGL